MPNIFKHIYKHPSLSLSQPLGYRHCKAVIGGWQKSEKLRHLLTDRSEEERDKKRRQHLMEKFEVG